MFESWRTTASSAGRWWDAAVILAAATAREYSGASIAFRPSGDCRKPEHRTNRPRKDAIEKGPPRRPPLTHERRALDHQTALNLLALADHTAQHLPPGALPVGVVTVVAGGAYLAWLLAHERRRI
ncbi:hypothetical protein [Streptomyces sp. NPDC004134]|uniref:hypothetical protein n=1 Tax=Streptomyces sp. NPDC004134 TaxID=3364691 RepID=UPI0036C4CC71